jgi:hypothetical protein
VGHRICRSNHEGNGGLRDDILQACAPGKLVVEQMHEHQTDQFIRIEDPDTPIYRMFPLWRLEEALQRHELVLVRPTLWDDPFELIGEPIKLTTRRGGRVENNSILNNLLPPAFGQCWSATGESDTLLRAYSRVEKDPHFKRNTCPQSEGVQVRSSPRKLFAALKSGAPAERKGNWFVGAVKYLPRKELFDEIAAAIRQHGPQVFEHPVNRARLLLMKRDAFSHEAEVRVIFVQKDQKPEGPIFPVKVDPSVVFDEIAFDPRLKADLKAREDAIRNLGFNGTFRKWDLYGGRTVLHIIMDI